MFSQFVASLSTAKNVVFHETISSLKLAYICSVGAGDPINDICSLLSEISDRDTFELHIETGGSLIKFSCLPIDPSCLVGFRSDAEEIGEITITLAVKKVNIGATISIYSIAAFEDYLTSSKLSSVLATLSTYLDSNLHFEVRDSIAAFATQTISFGPHQAPNRTHVESRNLIIANFKECASFSGVINFKNLPNDFHLRDLSGRNVLNKFFALACGMLSLIYLSNVSELSSDDKFSFRMFGYKAINADSVDPEYIIQNASMLYKIYRWVYDTDTVADRLGLARNVISLHLDQDGLPILSQAVWDAIHSNYKIYLKGNIESYLEVKGKIAELLLEAINKTNQLSENLLDSLKNNALIIITFLLTVVIVNGVKDLSVAAIFSVPYLIVVIILCLFSWVWLILLRNDTRGRFKAASQTLANILRTNYGAILQTDEIDRSVNPAIAENEIQLNRQIDKYSKWWQVMLGTFVLLYIIGFAAYNLFLIEERNKGKVIIEKRPEIEIRRGLNERTTRSIGTRRIGPEM